MTAILLLLPILALLSGFLLYSKNGRKEFLKFDLVQFFYAFILAPMLFVWLRAFVYMFVRQELGINLTLGQLYIVDTTVSLIFLYTYAFIVIHSLTKSFENKRYKDPLYDMFLHSETLHLWVSHVGIYLGGMTIFTLLSIINLYLPMQISMTTTVFWMSIFGGVILGIIAYGGYWLSIFSETFLKIIKLLIGLFWLIHMIAYIVASPSLSSPYVVYWVIFTAFTTQLFVSFFFEKSEKITNFIERFHHKGEWSAKRRNYKLSK